MVDLTASSPTLSEVVSRQVVSVLWVVGKPVIPGSLLSWRCFHWWKEHFWKTSSKITSLYPIRFSGIQHISPCDIYEEHVLLVRRICDLLLTSKYPKTKHKDQRTASSASCSSVQPATSAPSKDLIRHYSTKLTPQAAVQCYLLLSRDYPNVRMGESCMILD